MMLAMTACTLMINFMILGRVDKMVEMMNKIDLLIVRIVFVTYLPTKVVQKSRTFYRIPNFLSFGAGLM
jgi:hypothetical protein